MFSNFNVFISVKKIRLEFWKKNKINKEIVILKKVNDVEPDFVYLSSLTNLKISNYFKEEDYSTYDHSKIFLSTDHFLQKIWKRQG